MKSIAQFIARVLDSKGHASVIAAVRKEVMVLCARFPIYE
jgi:glycine/serine hydroxymethyltransferase